MNLLELTAVEIGKKIQNREISVLEAATASVQQIKKTEPSLHSFITIDEEAVYKDAVLIQERIDKGELKSPLAGVPMAVKDNICTKGLLTTCGSNMLRDFKPYYDARAVELLKQNGAVLLGKTNMDEFAMGSTTETSYFGATNNPWNTRHVPGGSSGGSCAAVAARECYYALGSDTGGSIRQPSAHCGVTGLKPTYGSVSRYGLIAYSSSMDQIGPIAGTVTDCASILALLISQDRQDSTSVVHTGPDFGQALKKDIRGMRVAVPKEYMESSAEVSLDPEVREAVSYSARLLEAEGADIEEISVPVLDYAVAAYYTIASAEAAANLSRFDGIRFGFQSKDAANLHEMYKNTRMKGFGKEVKRRIMLGNFVLRTGYYEAYYLKALKTKALIKQEFDRIFQDYDVILGPAAPTTAPQRNVLLQDPMQMYLDDLCTVAVNLAGLPALSLPCRLSSKGLPIGIQMIGNCFEESKIICCGHVLEQVRDFPIWQGLAEVCGNEKTV